MAKGFAMCSAPSAFETPARWSFELPTVASHFDAHVREQLPFYELATTAVADLVRFYLQPGGTLLDIGASTGNVSLACREAIEERNAKAINVEPSHEMAARFRGVGEMVQARIEDIEIPPCDVAVSFLTLGFVPPKRRRQLIGRILESVSPGGALVVVERVECDGNAFLAMASGRWAHGSAHWEAWLGTMALWSVFIATGYLVAVAWRRAVHRADPPPSGSGRVSIQGQEDTVTA